MNWLILAGHVAQHPADEGIIVVGTRDNGVHVPPGFVLAFSLSLAYAVRKRSTHIPLKQIPLLIGQEASDLPMSTGGTGKHCRQGSALTRMTHTKSVAPACSRPPSTYWKSVGYFTLAWAVS